MHAHSRSRSRGRRIALRTLGVFSAGVVCLTATSDGSGQTGWVGVAPEPPKASRDSAALVASGANGSISYAGTRVTVLRKASNGAEGVTKRSILVGRFNEKGKSDSRFGTDGVATFRYRKDIDLWPVSVASGPKGTLTVLGLVDLTPLFSETAPKIWPIVLRFTATGQLDRSFARRGYRVFRRNSYPAYTRVGGLAVTPGGRTVFGTDQDKSTPAVVRLTRNGSIDRRFGRSGTASLGLGSDSAPTDLYLSKAGVVTAVAVSRSSSPGLDQASCLASQIDSGGHGVKRFIGGGKRGIASGNSAWFNCQRVIAEHNGKIWIAGSLSLEPTPSDSDQGQRWQPQVTRLLRTGAPDATWGSNGSATSTPSGSFQLTSGIALDPAGGAVACSFRDRVELTKFDSAGTPVPTESSRLTATVKVRGSDIVGCANVGAEAIAVPGVEFALRSRAALQVLLLND